MPKTHLLNLSEYNFWVRLRIQIGIFVLGYVCILLKASAWSSLLGPRIFLWSFLLFYVSVFTAPIFSIIQIVLLGLIHDSLFNLPLGLSSFIWIIWHAFLAMQRRYLVKASISILWAVFAVMLSFFNSVECVILFKLNCAVSNLDLILETFLHIGMFPLGLYLFHCIFIRLGRFN